MTKLRIKRSSRINCYVLPEIKDMVIYLSKIQGRSITNMLEYLVKHEYEKQTYETYKS